MGPEKVEETSMLYCITDSSKADEMGGYAVPSLEPSLTVRSTDYFEFLTNNKLQSDMCPADDIIVSGKLLPLKHHCASFISPVIQIDGSHIEYRQRKYDHCRRSESSSELKPTYSSCSTKIRVVRNYSRKSDRSSVCSNSSYVPDLDRNYSWKSDRSSFGSPKMRKFRWQSLVFGIGMAKFPLEMKLWDIKNRQSRHSCPASLLFPATPESEAKLPAGGKFRGIWTSWGLIKALSCNGHQSISVNTSFGYMPRRQYQ